MAGAGGDGGNGIGTQCRRGLVTPPLGMVVARLEPVAGRGGPAPFRVVELRDEWRVPERGRVPLDYLSVVK